MDLASNGNDIILADNDGMIVGHTSRISPNAVVYEVQVLGTGDADSGIVVARHSADASGSEIVFAKGRDAIGTYTTALSDNDV